MSDLAIHQLGSCSCHASQFTVTGKPLMRAYCHCTICQAFNQADYGDVTLFYAKDVVMENEEAIDFRVYQQPPMLKRGKCKHCGKPAIEKLSIPLMPKMMIIPSSNLNDASFLPEPALHIFYGSRKADMEDGLPKFNGYLSSQLQFSFMLIKAMIRGGA